MQLAISLASLGVAVAAVGAGAWYFSRQVRELRNTEHRLEALFASIESTRQSTESLSNEMYAVLEFAKRAFSDPRLKTRLQSIAESYVKIQEKGGFLSTFVNSELDTCVEISLGAVRGCVEIRPVYLEPYAVQLLKMAEPGDRLFATSYVRTSAFWNSPRTKAYIRENEAAVKRGVNVTRIFLFDDEKALAESTQEMASQQKKGIDVRVALTKELEPELMRDLFYLENRIAAEYVLTPDRQGLLTLRFWTAVPEIKAIGNVMERLIEASQQHRIVGNTHEQG